MSGIRRNHLFILVQPLHDLERTATSKTFLLSIEIAVTTLCVEEKPFLFSFPRSLATASDTLFSATCLDATLCRRSYAFLVIGGGMFKKPHKLVSRVWPTPILQKPYTALTSISTVFIPLLRLSLVQPIWGEI